MMEVRGGEGDQLSLEHSRRTSGGWQVKDPVVKVLVAQLCLTLCDPINWLLCPWHSPGKNTGVGCHCLLQGIFQTQRLNLGLLHCSQILYCLSHQGRLPLKAEILIGNGGSVAFETWGRFTACPQGSHLTPRAQTTCWHTAPRPPPPAPSYLSMPIPLAGLRIFPHCMRVFGRC